MNITGGVLAKSLESVYSIFVGFFVGFFSESNCSHHSKVIYRGAHVIERYRLRPTT